MSSVHDISLYSFSERNHLFIDTSVWLLIVGPTTSYTKRKDVYTQGLSRARRANSVLYTNFIVISEFINRFARIEMSNAMINDFKSFRRSELWSKTADEISRSVRLILKRSVLIDTGFEAIDHDALMREFETGSLDFNDQVLTRLCKSRNLTFVTDDGDFVNSGLDLITGNKRLLASQ